MKIWTGVEMMTCTAICVPLEKGGALREHTVIKASGSWRNKRRSTNAVRTGIEHPTDQAEELRLS
jgi:hypothetical protein